MDNNIGHIEYTIAQNGERVRITSWAASGSIELTVEFEKDDDGRTIQLSTEKAIALGSALINIATGRSK